jgi:hypothetical protein
MLPPSATPGRQGAKHRNLDAGTGLANSRSDARWGPLRPIPALPECWLFPCGPTNGGVASPADELRHRAEASFIGRPRRQLPLPGRIMGVCAPRGGQGGVARGRVVPRVGFRAAYPRFLLDGVPAPGDNPGLRCLGVRGPSPARQLNGGVRAPERGVRGSSWLMPSQT